MTAHPQRSGDLAADEARSDHGHPSRAVEPGLELAQVVERAQHVDSWVVATGDREAGRLGTGRQQAVVVAELPAAGQARGALRGVQRDNAAADQLEPPAFEPRFALDRKLGFGALAAQQRLGQGWPVVRQPVLIGNDRHAAVIHELPKCASSGETGGAAADDQQCVRLGHRSSACSR